MRFIIMHKTSPHWEAGGLPGPGLVARVGAMINEIAAAKALLGADGLRPSAEGVRLVFSGGTRTISSGPFKTGNELPAGFNIVRASAIEDAIDWATRLAKILGDVEIDIRPVTEPWDIGITDKPSDIFTRRYMVLRKATSSTEADEPLSAAQEAELARLVDETTRSGVHVLSERMASSRRGRRYARSPGKDVAIYDGPFIETKELIGGYVIVSAASLDDAQQWALKYIETVPTDEVDLRELA
jgi:hypothetical protein